MEKPNILQPKTTTTQNNEFFKDLNNENENKSLNIDLQIKDTHNFYINIPESYSKSLFNLTFDITYIYDLNSIISNITLVFINKSDKNVFFKILNKNCYYQNDFNNNITKNSIVKLNVEVVNEDFFLITKLDFHK